MKTVAEKIRELQEKEVQIKGMGGAKAVEKQHASGKLTARERLDLFFDPGTFRETDIFVKHRCVNFGMEKVEIPADGVVTGFGQVNGRPVFAFAQDFTSRAGSLGEMHSKKICKVMDLALKAGVPFVGFNDSGGARIQEGVDSLSAYGQIFYRNAIASGVIPQISAIMGPTAGGAVYSPAMTDFIFMVKNTSYMFITGPDVIKSVTGEEITFEDLGGAIAHNMKSGVAQFACESDADAIEQIKKLLSFLPNNNMEDPPLTPCTDPPGREEPTLDAIVPDDPRLSYAVHDVIRAIVDHGDFFEPHAHFAQNMVVGLGALEWPDGRHHRQQPPGAGGLPGRGRGGQGHAVDPLLRRLQYPAPHHRGRARVPARLRPGVARHHPPRGEALVVLLRGHGAQADAHDPQGLRGVVPGLCAPGTWAWTWSLPGPPRRSRSWGPRARPTSSSAKRSRRPWTPWPNALGKNHRQL